MTTYSRKNLYKPKGFDFDPCVQNVKKRKDGKAYHYMICNFMNAFILSFEILINFKNFKKISL